MNIEKEINDSVSYSVEASVWASMSVYCKLHSCIHNSLDKQALQDTYIMGQRVRDSARVTAIKTEEHKKNNK